MGVRTVVNWQPWRALIHAEGLRTSGTFGHMREEVGGSCVGPLVDGACAGAAGVARESHTPSECERRRRSGRQHSGRTKAQPSNSERMQTVIGTRRSRWRRRQSASATGRGAWGLGSVRFPLFRDLCAVSPLWWCRTRGGLVCCFVNSVRARGSRHDGRPRAPELPSPDGAVGRSPKPKNVLKILHRSTVDAAAKNKCAK